ncbi:DUF7010 family protein [Erythrobacter sp.]|jgi:hypothetical protein|uniref:DUF7010 family protein n=1 Tax=Erythrobacter sp. TaxID=1042 RepID=UPI002EAF962C|nr:hypothetical protein [Erythrobacter sp.]
MTDYATVPLGEARRRYLANSTVSMPIAGFISWAALAVAYAVFADDAPFFAPFVAAAIPVPIALAMDKRRGELHRWKEDRDNPIGHLFMRFITVVGLLIPLVVIGASAMQDEAFLVLGLAILAGVVWVPHGWGADDPAGFIHFVLRAGLCYAVYLLTPPEWRSSAIAAVTAATYIYAIAAMRKPSSVQ